MTRLLFLLPLLAGVLATEMTNGSSDSMGSKDMMAGKDNMGSKDMMGGNYNMGGDNKGGDNKGGDNKGGDNKMGANVEIKVSVDITVIESSMGGGAQVQKMAPPPMAPGKTHMITVGGSAGLIYSPSYIQAEIGDLVQFQFMKANHTITQSTFPKPCVKMSGGIDSGFMPNANDTLSPPPMYTVQVMTKEPTWFYCRQRGHCGMGMVFSINPSVEKSQAIFLAAAIAQNGTASSTMATAMASTSATVVVAAASAPPAYTSATVVVAAPPPPAYTPPPPAYTPPPPAAAPPAAAPKASAPPAAAPPPPPAALAAPASGSNVAAGAGSGNGDSCSCSCFCGVAAFPAMAGMHSFGGMGGAMPAMPVS